jgi:hypothetical protein
MSHELIAARMFERKRRLLPKLQLKYPNDTESQKLSKLAGVDDRSIFSSHLRSIILDAHLNDAALRGLSMRKIEDALKKVMASCRELRHALSAIDVGTGGSAERAGFLFEMELCRDSFKGQMILIPDCLEFVGRVNDAACRAAVRAKSKRGPKGTAGSPAFGAFIESLQMAAWQRRGDWTNFRSAAGSWTGSFLQAVGILKPYLPADFLPRGEIGRAIEHVRKKLKDHITKNRPSSE